MALSTFTELKASIADFLNRSDLTSVIPDFITLAEDELNLRLNHWRGEKRSTASTAGQYLDLPDDWLETKRISITGDTTYELDVASQADIMERRAESNDTAGRPQFYCVTGGQIEFYPTPDDTYTVELVYRAAVDGSAIAGRDHGPTCCAAKAIPTGVSDRGRLQGCDPR